MDQQDQLTQAVIGAAIEVHRCLGPGLLESAYQACLCRELDLRGQQSVQRASVAVLLQDAGDGDHDRLRSTQASLAGS